MIVEYFEQVRKDLKCNVKRDIYSIDGAILYKDSDNALYHYFFKNVNIENIKYLAFSKCRLFPDTLGTQGDYLKIEPNYPKVVNNINMGGIYFTEDYREPKYISAIFTINKKFVENYLDIQTDNQEIIVVIQDSKVIFCTLTKRLVNKPINIEKIWKGVKRVNCGIVDATDSKLFLFSNNSYYTVTLPFSNKEISKKSLNKKSLWNYSFGTECKNIDAIVRVYTENNISNQFYIFQNEKYIRYPSSNGDKTNAIIESDITSNFAKMLYGQLLIDLNNTKEELKESHINEFEDQIQKNDNNIFKIINKLSKKKIKLFNKKNNDKHLFVKFNKPIDANENIIINYTNIIEDYNNEEITSKNENCDIETDTHCINVISKDDINYYDVISTYTANESGNLIIDISNDFNLKSVLYVRTYPNLIKNSMVELFRGNNLQNETIYNILLNLSDSSANLGIDSVIYVNNMFYFYKNYVTNNSKSFVKYATANISNFKYVHKYTKMFPVINLSLENESLEFNKDDINTAGNMIEILSLCKMKDNMYYIFGKIKNSEMSRVLVYNSTTQKVDKYAKDISKLFKIDNINNIIAVFNLDPNNILKLNKPILCFIISTPNSIAEIVTNYEKLQNCDKNDCKSISDDKFKRIYNVYKNFKKIPDIQKINAVIYENDILYVFKQNMCERYENMEKENAEIEYDEIDMKDLLKDGFNIRHSYLQECECSEIVKVVPPKIKMEVSDNVLEKKKKINTDDLFFGLYCTFLAIILMIYYYFSHVRARRM